MGSPCLSVGLSVCLLTTFPEETTGPIGLKFCTQVPLFLSRFHCKIQPITLSNYRVIKLKQYPLTVRFHIHFKKPTTVSNESSFILLCTFRHNNRHLQGSSI